MIGVEPLGIDDVVDAAHGRQHIALHPDAAEVCRCSHEALQRQLAEGRAVYGVTTGFGDDCVRDVESADSRLELARNLVRFHGCGTGACLTPEETTAVMVVRAVSLSRGHSAVRPVVVERLCQLVNSQILPRIPCEGSVGASGDLTPLSYIAAVLSGSREVLYEGELTTTARVFDALGIEPLALLPKESLALMNGTSVMTGLAALACSRARKLARAAATVSAMVVDVLDGNASHFDARIFEAKPHPGQARAAGWIRDALVGGPDRPAPRIQDRYSLRCAPHVIGVLVDALPMLETFVETEINSVNDNPIFDPATGDVLHGGNFYGGHIAFAMDALKAAVASIADLLDRQVQHLCNPAYNNALTPSLAWPGGSVGHGFKAVSIATSALTAEALKLTMPAASFSRSTECHNQDKVSMGTIAARDAQRVLELSETVAIMNLLAACQAVDLRGEDALRPATMAVHAEVRLRVAPVKEDRRQDLDIAELLGAWRRGELALGGDD